MHNEDSIEHTEPRQKPDATAHCKQTKNATQTETEVVTVKFRNAGKQYDFSTNELQLKCQDQVVVETSRGRALGTVVRAPRTIVDLGKRQQELKKVLRLATEADINMTRISRAKETEAFDFCAERIKKRNLPMNLVKADYLFDGSKILFHFTAENRIDFRDLVKDLAHHFHTRIEMRQIGVRDEAKLLGGLGICGRELCCSTFITEFQPVSVKMAKQQGLALNPSKISGQCGRLLCCLGYEYETYCSMAKKLPKTGRKIQFNGQETTVTAVNILAQSVNLRIDGKNIEVPIEQLYKDRDNAEHSGQAKHKDTGSAPESTPKPKDIKNTRNIDGNRRVTARTKASQTLPRNAEPEAKKNPDKEKPSRPEGRKSKPDSRRRRPKQRQPVKQPDTPATPGTKGNKNNPEGYKTDTTTVPGNKEQTQEQKNQKKRPPRQRNKRRPKPKPKT